MTMSLLSFILIMLLSKLLSSSTIYPCQCISVWNRKIASLNGIYRFDAMTENYQICEAEKWMDTYIINPAQLNSWMIDCSASILAMLENGTEANGRPPLIGYWMVQPCPGQINDTWMRSRDCRELLTIKCVSCSNITKLEMSLIDDNLVLDTNPMEGYFSSFGIGSVRTRISTIYEQASSGIYQLANWLRNWRSIMNFPLSNRGNHKTETEPIYGQGAHFVDHNTEFVIKNGTLRAEVKGREVGLNIEHHVRGDRRRDTNDDSCSTVDYTVGNCWRYRGLEMFTDDWLSFLCVDGGETDKSINAKLCERSYSDDAYTSFKLALVNQMYGSDNIPERSSCVYWCMYDPLNTGPPTHRGFQWLNELKCWDVVNAWFCYDPALQHEWNWAINKSENWCPGSVCNAYGDPHIFPFEGDEMALGPFTAGDFTFVETRTLRVDVRLRDFYDQAGVRWSQVTGIHATAIKVVDPEANCPVLIEFYSKYQSADGFEAIYFNGQSVDFSELEDYLGNCDQICSEQSVVDADGDMVTILFADQAMVTLRNIAGMQRLFVTIPTEDRMSYEVLYINQLCTETIEATDCENNPTIFSWYDYVNGTSLTCEEASNFTRTNVTAEECDINIHAMGDHLCTSCDVNCLLDSFVESCIFDICLSDGVNTAWEEGSRAEAEAEAKSISDMYCNDMVTEMIAKPWLCPSDPTGRPSLSPVSRPSWAPTEHPTNQPSSKPTKLPSNAPSRGPTLQPSKQPSKKPTLQPSKPPSKEPTVQPSTPPSKEPTKPPSKEPTKQPSKKPTSQPSKPPSKEPTVQPSTPPSKEPTKPPSKEPTKPPSKEPTLQPSTPPSKDPTVQPSKPPSKEPTVQPSKPPSKEPTIEPSKQPSQRPSDYPTVMPSFVPTANPTFCEGANVYCNELATLGHCLSDEEDIRAIMERNCELSCGPCHNSTAPTQRPSKFDIVIPVSEPTATPSINESEQLPNTCQDENELCFILSLEGYCFSELNGTLVNEVCKQSCGLCESTCYSGTWIFYPENKANCCFVPILNEGNTSYEFHFAWLQFNGDNPLVKTWTNDSTVCQNNSAFIVPPIVDFGRIVWVSLPGCFFGAAILTFLGGNYIFGARNSSSMESLLRKMAAAAGLEVKASSAMSASDFKTIATHYEKLFVAKYEEVQWVSGEITPPPPDPAPPGSSYEILKELFQNTSLQGSSSVDVADFTMVIGKLGVSPWELAVESVFNRLDNGTGQVSVDDLWEAIKNNVPEASSKAEMLQALKQGLQKTYARERLASLSIIKKFKEATVDDEISASFRDEDESRDNYYFSTHNLPHNFNATLVAMGVSMSNADVRKRVIALQELNPEIDVEEFKMMVDDAQKSNPWEAKNDSVIKVLDELIQRSEFF